MYFLGAVVAEIDRKPVAVLVWTGNAARRFVGVAVYSTKEEISHGKHLAIVKNDLLQVQVDCDDLMATQSSSPSGCFILTIPLITAV